MLVTLMNAVWILALLICLLSAGNAIFWGFTIREVGDPEFSLRFLFKLILNKWFLLAMAFAFTASLLSYSILKKMGVLAGRFFLSLNIVSTILACTLVLGESLGLREWIGIILVTIGALLVGKW